MALTAKDVHDKQFKLVRQSTGYDIDEVDAFLDEVEAEFARLHGELDEARAAAGAAPTGSSEGAHAAASDEAGDGGESAAGPAEALTGSAARILELAQRTADEYLAEARRTADTLVEEAEAKARSAVATLEAQRSDLEARVSALRSFESEVRTRLTSYFESQLNDLRAIDRPTG
jgi:DivIVA domain-containing protein